MNIQYYTILCLLSLFFSVRQPLFYLMNQTYKKGSSSVYDDDIDSINDDMK